MRLRARAARAARAVRQDGIRQDGIRQDGIRQDGAVQVSTDPRWERQSCAKRQDLATPALVAQVQVSLASNR